MKLMPPVLLAALLAAPVLPAAGPAPAGAPKTHTLYLGADISLVTGKGTLLPVRDIQDHAFVAVDHGKRVVASQDDKFSLKLDDALKLTAESASIEKLTFERSYTAAADPMTRFKDAARASAYMDAVADAALLELKDAESQTGYASAGLATAAADPNATAEALAPWQAAQAQASSAMARADTASGVARNMTSMDAFSSVSNSNILASDLAAQRFDALNVSFEISAPRPIEKPYVVVVMRFLGEQDQADTARVWVYAERLPALDEHPRKVLIRRGGFPPGYQIESHRVHLYEGGREIATNVSRKRVALSAADAFAYSVSDYVSSNRGQTRDPSKARAFWPADLPSRLIVEQLTRTLYVKVDKSGLATGIYEDADCARPIADESITALTPELRFFPALKEGKPIAGITRIKLAKADN